MLQRGLRAPPRTTWRRARCARRRSTPSACCWRRASALAADGDLLAAEERARDRARWRRRCARRAAATIATPIDAALKALADGTEAFAAERMNRGIRRALAGRRVEDV